MSRRKVAPAILACALLAFSMTGCSDDFKADCESAGGSVSTSTKTGVGSGVSTTGKPVLVTTVSETRYCLKDGGVLDVE